MPPNPTETGVPELKTLPDLVPYSSLSASFIMSFIINQ